MNLLKGVLIFAAGAGIGSGVSIALVRKKYQEKAESDIKEMREYYDKLIKETLDEKKLAEDKETADKIINEQGYISYDTMSREELRDRVKTVSEQAIEEANPSEDYPDSPFVITEPAFSEDELYFEKVCADYYMDDGALVDENEELINVDDCIGLENLDRFLSSNEGVMYIRNPKLATDYEVTKVGGKYSDILGLGGDEEDD